jgi:hypothetical protein
VRNRIRGVAVGTNCIQSRYTSGTALTLSNVFQRRVTPHTLRMTSAEPRAAHDDDNTFDVEAMHRLRTH